MIERLLETALDGSGATALRAVEALADLKAGPKALTGALAWHSPTGDAIEARPQVFGDVVLARKDVPTSYHLAVTVDDHLQGITVVTRGEDLYQATHVHRLLQALLGLKTPLYEHHRLLVGETGRRLAKRDQGLTLRALRQSGKSPAEVRRMVGYD